MTPMGSEEKYKGEIKGRGSMRYGAPQINFYAPINWVAHTLNAL
jgi:hypothetical protein